MTDTTVTPAPATKKPRRLGRAAIVLGVALLAAGGGVYWLTSEPTHVSTDNAYLKADKSIVAPKLRGLVAEVLVHENQTVAAGDALIRIDDEDYRAHQSAAEADVAEAEAALASAKASLQRLDAERALAEANAREADTGIRTASAEHSRAQSDLERYKSLAAQDLAPRQKFETASATATSATANVDRAKAALDVASAQIAVVDGRRAELEAGIAAALAAKAKAQAALALAKQDVDHTIVRAPIAGVVGDLQVEPGEYVQPGSRLLAIVPTGDIYVVANFKETQTGRMLEGQRVDVEVDALTGVSLSGVVESLSPGSGSEFALLPFEPGTGNFTKIVQRVPVRIRLDAQQAKARLRPGLSATVTVDLESEPRQTTNEPAIAQR